MKLTIKQKAFADYYIQLGNATEAYIKAGYKNFKSAGVEGNKTLKNPNVKKYIEARLKELASERIADQTEVLEYLTGVLRGQSESEVVVTVGIGMGESVAKRIQKHPDEKERLKAAEMLGKVHNIFSNNTNEENSLNKLDMILEGINNVANS